MSEFNMNQDQQSNCSMEDNKYATMWFKWLLSPGSTTSFLTSCHSTIEYLTNRIFAKMDTNLNQIDHFPLPLVDDMGGLEIESFDMIGRPQEERLSSSCPVNIGSFFPILQNGWGHKPQQKSCPTYQDLSNLYSNFQNKFDLKKDLEFNNNLKRTIFKPRLRDLDLMHEEFFDKDYPKFHELALFPKRTFSFTHSDEYFNKKDETHDFLFEFSIEEQFTKSETRSLHSSPKISRLDEAQLEKLEISTNSTVPCQNSKKKRKRKRRNKKKKNIQKQEKLDEEKENPDFKPAFIVSQVISSVSDEEDDSDENFASKFFSQSCDDDESVDLKDLPVIDWDDDDCDESWYCQGKRAEPQACLDLEFNSCGLFQNNLFSKPKTVNIDDLIVVSPASCNDSRKQNGDNGDDDESFCGLPYETPEEREEMLRRIKEANEQWNQIVISPDQSTLVYGFRCCSLEPNKKENNKKQVKFTDKVDIWTYERDEND